MPIRLRDVGVTQQRLDVIAETSFQNHWVRTNPRHIRDAADAREIVEAAW